MKKNVEKDEKMGRVKQGEGNRKCKYYEKKKNTENVKSMKKFGKL